jgi:hypothetical protein
MICKSPLSVNRMIMSYHAEKQLLPWTGASSGTISIMTAGKGCSLLTVCVQVYMTETAPKPIELSILPYRLAICRLDPSAQAPKPALEGEFFSVTRTPDELSFLVPEENAVKGARVEGGWRAFKVKGPLDFSLTGILSSIAAPLAAAKISIFALSTFDTDYILVKEAHLEQADRVLREAGFKIRK